MIRAVIASTIVFGLAGLLATVARRASASVRHAIWFVGIVTSLGVGALAAVGPVFEVESSIATRDVRLEMGDRRFSNQEFVAPLTATDSRVLPSQSPIPDRQSPVPLPTALWVIGALLIVGRALAAQIGAARLVSRATH